MKFSGVITNDRSEDHAKVKIRGQMSRSQRSKSNLAVSKLYLQFEFTYDNVMMMLWIIALLFFKVIRQISRSYGYKMSILTQIRRFRTATQVRINQLLRNDVTPVWIHWWLWNDAQSLYRNRKCALLISKVIHQMLRSHGPKYTRFWCEIGISGL